MLNYERFDKLVDENIIYSNHPSKGKFDTIKKKKSEFLMKEKEESEKMTTEKSVESTHQENKEEIKVEIVPEVQAQNKEKLVVPNETIKKQVTIREKPLEERKRFLSRFKEILTSVLTYLYDNKISIQLYFGIHPFPKSPFSKASMFRNKLKDRKTSLRKLN